jgi:hypothetical protein
MRADTLPIIRFEIDEREVIVSEEKATRESPPLEIRRWSPGWGFVSYPICVEANYEGRKLMPDHTPISKFIKTLRTRKTDITRSLDELFDMAYRDELLIDPNIDTFKNTPNVLDILPQWARDILQRPPRPGIVRDPVSEEELDHIDSWPNEQKEKVRRKLVDAIDGGRAVYFFWELYRGDVEHVGIDDVTSGECINITFFSPFDNITEATGEIQVSVGP